MTRNWLQALAVVLVTGVIVFALGWGLLTWQTASTRFLEPAPMTTAAPATVDQGNALDAALDGALDGGGTVTTNALGNQMETQRKRAADGLVDGFMKLMIITTAVALGWTLLAWSQVSKVGRPETQRTAQGVWLVGYLVVTVAAAILLWLTFNRQGPASEATATATGTTTSQGSTPRSRSTVAGWPPMVTTGALRARCTGLRTPASVTRVIPAKAMRATRDPSMPSPTR
mgnify:CR=1 FL=1